jgi:alkanesulfonate monooxygenase SsuD/methylene tetrahydromethanopterin reductase-like flavin-dependent oxidoreductase (luciferase family)
VQKKVATRSGGKYTPAELRQRGLVIGTPDELSEQLTRLAEAGVQEVMLQWLDLDDIDGLQGLAEKVLPRFRYRE